MRLVRVLVLVLCFAGQRLAAQTVDWGRITIGLSGGLRFSSSLWDVPNQPVLSSNFVPHTTVYYPSDLFHLHREVRSGLTLTGQATFYSTPSLGFTFELTYLGLQLIDSCTVTHDGGDPELTAACAYVGSSQEFGAYYSHPGASVDHSAAATLIEGGVILRPFKPAALQPFFKGMIGFATTPHSTLALESIYGAIADTTLGEIIYQDPNPPEARPVLTAAVGMTTAPQSGLQVHFEARETLLPLAIINGPTISQNLIPPSHTVFKGFFSIMIGLEIVLSRQRGKRY